MLLQRFEAGLELTGTEVKAIRAGKANLQEAWVRLDDDGELTLRIANAAFGQQGWAIEQGYLDARLGPARLERIGEERAAVLVPVVEGPQTRLTTVRLRGASMPKVVKVTVSQNTSTARTARSARASRRKKATARTG